MSTETTADAEIPQATVTELASDLGEAITQLPTYQEFLEAKERVEESEEAQQKVQRFEQLREEFMLARQTGNATNEDLRELQAAQEELHDVPVMSEFLELQSELELELQELNEMISAPLAVDFGEKAGGCCQD
ncbi:YlbF family regulator [Halocatena salina]|uniref:YlbF family regulator n=1 Tax=Halocatena salina TaxID=2934340 RepID=A0A8U0A201_9EURY|nr:YlbF family regulator [Halocatena salina]UPM42017.1 YlbF family regulator [Halocatena salina]